MHIDFNAHSVEDLFRYVLAPNAIDAADWEPKMTSTTFATTADRKAYTCLYFPANFAEYWTGFQELLQLSPPEPLQILSIGSGASIDYCTLKLTESQRKIPIIRSYHGIDLHDWHTDIGFKIENADYKFEQANVVTKPSRFFARFDLIVFGKSLGDLPAEAIGHISEALARSPKKQIYFLNSYITVAAKKAVFGISAFEKIAASLIAAGYDMKSNLPGPHYYNYLGDSDQGLKSGPRASWWTYPNDLKGLVSKHLGKNPILTASYLNYAAFRFQKP